MVGKLLLRWKLPILHLIKIWATLFCTFVVLEYPQLTNIDGRADSVGSNTLTVSFLKWNQQMGGNTAPTEYVITFLSYLCLS